MPSAGNFQIPRIRNSFDISDSSVAHLAALLGRTVWNLLGSFAYWLYMHVREYNPCYPTMKLIRQQKPGDWDGVFETVEQKIRTSFKASS